MSKKENGMSWAAHDRWGKRLDRQIYKDQEESIGLSKLIAEMNRKPKASEKQTNNFGEGGLWEQRGIS